MGGLEPVVRAAGTARAAAARGLRDARPFLPAAVRVLVGGGTAAALVWGVTAAPVDLDLDLAAADGSATGAAAGTSLATTVAAGCPGNELSGIAGVEDVAVDGTVTVATGPQTLLPVPAQGPGGATLSSGPVSLATAPAQRPGTASGDLPRGGPVALEAEGSLAPAATGTQEWVAGSPDLRGLVTTPCLPARSELWLLGGGDGPGRQERLVLTNPGGNPVTAEVTIHGTSGQVGESRSETVAPGGRVSLLLDAVAGEEAAPAVHVAASGGGLHASLTDTWVTGSTPRGAETVVPAADPATVQVVPAAVLGAEAVLRVVVPGEEEAVASISLLGPEGEVTTTQDTVLTVGAGSVGELTLPAVPPGTYSVVVSSDVPVVSAVRSRSGSPEGPGDIGWAVASPVVTDVTGMALPATEGVQRVLRLVSTGGASTAVVTLVVQGAQRERTVTLVSERSAQVDLAGASAVWVRRTSGAGALRAGVVSTAGAADRGLLSVLSLDPVQVTSPVSRAFPLP